MVTKNRASSLAKMHVLQHTKRLDDYPPQTLKTMSTNTMLSDSASPKRITSMYFTDGLGKNLQAKVILSG